MSQQCDEDEAVRHLVALGYVDPDEVAAHQAELRRRHQADLGQSAKLAKHGRGAEAAAVLEKLIEADPGWVTPHQLLAEIYCGAGRLRESRSQLEWLEYHGIESPRLSLVTGAVAIARRELRVAVDHLEYARQMAPDLPRVHTLLGSAWLRLGMLELAEESLRRALEYDPADPRALDEMAALYFRRGDYESAVDWALQALSCDIQSFRAQYILGVALISLGRSEEAWHALETSARVNPTRAAPYYWLARIAANRANNGPRSTAYRDRGRDIVRRRREQRCPNVGQ